MTTRRPGPIGEHGGGPASPLSPRATDPADQKFAEPVALSSTQPADRPLPRRASRLSLDLIALRARRGINLCDQGESVKWPRASREGAGGAHVVSSPAGDQAAGWVRCISTD